MRRIDLGEGEDADESSAASGLLALVVAVVELLVEAMEREAIRRMESGSLAPEEIDRLGTQLLAIEEEIERIKERENLGRDVDRLRGDLDDLLSEGIDRIVADEREGLEP
ncbi:gas vesicle protein GvpK [Natronorarus salvus]|uniref:gas vesicle protein GvpK n=1 Tax=Natronorarus salvus TaxID=3117733 RepID=UPI002F269E37